jgi:hypothetical protein
MEMEHTVIAFPDAGSIYFREQPRCAARQRGNKVFWLLCHKIRLRQELLSICLQSRAHGVVRHQSIQVIDGRALYNATSFPREDCLSHCLPQLPYRLYGSLSTTRTRPPAFKVCSLPRTNQASRAKPLHECLEIREEFNRFGICAWMRVQEVERHIVPQKEKSVFPVCGLFCLTLFHIVALQENYTPVTNHLIG